MTMPSLSVWDNFAKAAVALVYASSQVLIALLEKGSPAVSVSYGQSCWVFGDGPEAWDSAAVDSMGMKRLRILNCMIREKKSLNTM